jgi:hypothetical protein
VTLPKKAMKKRVYYFDYSLIILKRTGQLIFYLPFFFSLELEPRASCKLGKHATTEVYPQLI